MNYLKGFVWLSAGLMMLAMGALFANLYFTLDAREQRIEDRVSTGFNILSYNLNSTLNAKTEDR